MSGVGDATRRRTAQENRAEVPASPLTAVVSGEPCGGMASLHPRMAAPFDEEACPSPPRRPSCCLALATTAGAQTLSNSYFKAQIGTNGEISSLQLTGDAFPTNYVLNATNARRAEHRRPRVGGRADVHLSAERRRLDHRAHQPVGRRPRHHHRHQLGHRHLPELGQRQGGEELQARRDLRAGERLPLLADYRHQHQHADDGDGRLRVAAAVQRVLEPGQRRHLRDADRLSLVHRQQQLVHHRRAAERRRPLHLDDAGSDDRRRVRVHGQLGARASTPAAPGPRAAARPPGRTGSTSFTSTRTSSRAPTAATCRTPASRWPRAPARPTASSSSTSPATPTSRTASTAKG